MTGELSATASDDPVAADAEALGAAWIDVEAAQAGDREAFERLYHAYARMVHGIVLAHARVAEAEDLVQDVFIVAFRTLPQLREPEAFGGWLSQIARRRAIDGFRRRRLDDPLPDDPPTRGACDISEALAILQVIRSLAPAYRETLILRLIEGMTGPEIALKTGRTAGSVRVNLHRGMAQLRRKLGGEDHG
jgi:RNA polymerase sigma-70 factor (ECF subfamily)